MNKPIRVLQVGMSPNYGGTESFIMSQYRSINREIVQFDFLNVYNVPIACEEEIKKLGGKIYHLDLSRRHGIIKYFKRIDSFFKNNKDGIDIVHCNVQSLINIDMLKYAKKNGIQGRIIHAHNAGYGVEPNSIQKAIIRHNKKKLAAYANQYFACSSLAGQWMFGDLKTTIVKNAINVEKFQYNIDKRNEFRSKNNLQNNKVALFVGRLDPQKNPLFLVNIFSKMILADNSWKLLIVGDGILRVDVEKEIAKLGLQEYVSMLGSRNDVDLIMQGADCFLLPSKFEGLGIVLIEAQTAGLKCFTSKDVVPSEVDVTGLVDFISLNDMADKWAEIICKYGDNYKRKNQQENVIKAGFSSDKNADELENLYIKLVAGEQ